MKSSIYIMSLFALHKANERQGLFDTNKFRHIFCYSNSNETFEKGLILLKFKGGENFNNRRCFMKNTIKMLVILVFAVTLFIGIMSVQAKAAEPAKAVAVLYPTQGNTAKGAVYFTQTNQGVRVAADIKSLTPGLHGFHIHQFGDCSATDGTSAGGHFNPAAEQHGGPDAAHRHAGDLGNLSADNSGSAHYDRVDSNIQISGPNSILGRAIIVHAQPDDLASQPTGNAGARVACGVIGIAKE